MKRHHICSEEADFVKHKRETTSWFLKHGYPEIGIKIEVEKIRAPLFITGAEDDGQWYSAVAGDRIVERLQRYNFEYSVKYKRVASAGHFIDYPQPVMNELNLFGFHPHAGIWISNGGSASVMARAQREIFPDTVAFFQEALNKKKSSEE